MTEDNIATTANDTKEEKKEPLTLEQAEANKKAKDDKAEARRKDRKISSVGKRGPREPKEFEESILQIARVTRVVKGGRRMRFRVSVIIGDRKGRVGFGIGKSTEVMGGIQKAVAVAKKKLTSVSIFEDSIPHEVVGTFKATKVILLPAPEGTGVIAGGAVRKILELAGVKNVLSKLHGSRNALNVAYATFQALSQLQSRAPEKKKEDEDEKAKKKAPAKKGEEGKKAKPAPKKEAGVKADKKKEA